MRYRLLQSQKGLTLIELLAVMAIIAVLASIIIPAVSGTGEAGREAQGQQDGGATDSAAGDFFAAQNGAEIITPETVTLTTTVNGSVVASTTQTISSRWPELFIAKNASSLNSAAYQLEFPTAASPATTNVTLTSLGGALVSGTTLLTQFTAVDFAKLLNGKFMQSKPNSVDTVSTVSGVSYHTFLWLLEKTSSTAGTNDTRKVALFKLVSATKAESTGGTLPALPTFVLKYERIF